MTSLALPYYQVDKGRGFFVLGRARAAAVGWIRRDGTPKGSIPLGPDGPAAWAAARELHAAYLAALAGAPPAPRTAYPKGSLGAWYDYWRASEAFKRKAARTREDYERGWAHIRPKLAFRRIDQVSVAEFEAWQLDVEARLSPSERFRAVKAAKALFNAAARANVIKASPALTLPNPQPSGRSAIWLAAEVDAWATAADALGYDGVGLAIRIMWETAFAPVDVRTATLAMRGRDARGAWLARPRTKTQAAAYGLLSPELDAMLDAYVARLGVELGPGAPFIRQPTGKRADGRRRRGAAAAYVEKNLFAKHARLARIEAFGAEEDRQLLDIRRSANVEAALGGASAEERARILANTMHKNRALEATYTPETVALARQVAEKRQAGRVILARESMRRS